MNVRRDMEGRYERNGRVGGEVDVGDVEDVGAGIFAVLVGSCD